MANGTVATRLSGSAKRLLIAATDAKGITESQTRDPHFCVRAFHLYRERRRLSRTMGLTVANVSNKIDNSVGRVAYLICMVFDIEKCPRCDDSYAKVLSLDKQSSLLSAPPPIITLVNYSWRSSVQSASRVTWILPAWNMEAASRIRPSQRAASFDQRDEARPKADTDHVQTIAQLNV